MLFTQQEIQRLLEIVDYHSSFVAGSVLGKEVLSDYDRYILQKHGIDIEKIREGKETSYFEMYMWGKLSALLSDSQAKEITYEDFEKYIKRGQYIPLSKTEQYQYDVAKQKTYGYIKGLGDRIKQTVNGIVVEENQVRRAEYEKVIKEELERGVVDRKSVTSIVSEIGHKTEDWYRDWGRIVETEYQNIYQQGRAEQLLQERGIDTLVFKDVFQGACRHCIRLYLTDGIGSEPILFKLGDLMANGDNIGLKVADWKPVVGSVHPFSITDKTTVILTDNGWKPIMNINIGDNVLTHKGRFRKVLSVLKDYPCPKDELHKLKYTIYYKHNNSKDPDNLVKLNMTGDHKVLTKDGWKMVKNLQVGDKLVKLMKRCVICDNYIESYNNDTRCCCSVECSNKYRSENVSNQWSNYTEKDLINLKNKISEKVSLNWENGVHENTLNNLKSKKRREDTKNRMLNGGAIKALKAQGGKITSKQQIKLYNMVLSLFPDAEIEYKIFNKSLDIAIVNHKIDIEFDGSNWHKNRIESDKKRDELLKENGWYVIRYEDKLPKLGKLRLDIETIIQNHDGLYKFDESEIVFIKRCFTDKNTKLYDIEVEEDESFIARGVVVHNCRCQLRFLPKGYKWDEEVKKFTIKPEDKPKYVRPKVKMMIGDKEVWV